MLLTCNILIIQTTKQDFKLINWFFNAVLTVRGRAFLYKLGYTHAAEQTNLRFVRGIQFFL